MQHKIYSIRDAKAEVFHPPFYKKTHGEAERDFHKLVNEPNNQVSMYPDDFDLYYLGDFDDNTGKTKPLDTPQHIQKAALIKQAQLN